MRLAERIRRGQILLSGYLGVLDWWIQTSRGTAALNAEHRLGNTGRGPHNAALKRAFRAADLLQHPPDEEMSQATNQS